ncbi:MAG: MATE family efflux transporter, partial [Rikenellaceae bacterium]
TPILSIFTDSSEVLHRALDFKYWIAAVPIISFVAFLYDGILVGATESAIMRNVMFIATSLFFVLYYCLHNHLENSALWISFLVYLLLRGVLQMWLYARKPLTNHR